MSVDANFSSREIIEAVGEAVKKNYSFDIVCEKGKYSVVTENIFQRIWHCRSSYRLEQDKRIIQVLTKCLDELKGLTPAQVGEHRTVRAVTNFYKKFSEDQLKQKGILEGNKALFATRLGVSIEVLENPLNLGFKDFAINNHIDRGMWKFSHKLDVDGQTGEISLFVNGGYVLWSAFQNSEYFDKGKRKINGFYGQNGIQKGDPVDWDEFKPFMRGDPNKWGKKYIFEYCVWYEDHNVARIAGDHVWNRLFDPEGNVYSIGIWPADKLGKLDKMQPTVMREAALESYDKSEVWPEQTYRTIQMEISEEKFLAIKVQVEEDKRKGLEFHTLQGNCTVYGNKLAAIAGVQFPSEISYARVLFPSLLVNASITIYSFLPSCLKFVADVVAALFLNFISLIAGSLRVDSNLLKKRKVEPYFSSILNWFDITKTYIHHPSKVAQVIDVIENWRKDEMAKKSDEEAEQFKYAVPPQYHLSANLQAVVGKGLVGDQGLERKVDRKVERKVKGNQGEILITQAAV